MEPLPIELVNASSFWDSQLFGVLIGALLAGGVTVFVELRRSRRDRLKAARDLRQAAHAEAIRAAYEVRESMIRVAVTSSVPEEFVRSLTAGDREDLEAERRKAIDWNDAAGRRFGEATNVVLAFGTHEVHEAAKLVGQATQSAIGVLQDTGALPSDADQIVDYLIGVMCKKARDDADAAAGATSPEPATRRESVG